MGAMISGSVFEGPPTKPRPRARAPPSGAWLGAIGVLHWGNGCRAFFSDPAEKSHVTPISPSSLDVRAADHPERFAQGTPGPNSTVVHRAYARNAAG